MTDKTATATAIGRDQPLAASSSVPALPAPPR